MTSLQFDLPKDQASIIKVFGVGGGGSNAVNHMYRQGIVGVNFVICNTDSQALDLSPVPNKIQLGPALTQGLGAGSNPEMGAQATVESEEEVRALLSKNTKMVFVTAGMGGGTGTGGAPVVAKVAREMGILTVGIVTTPFSFEGKRKFAQALEGIEKMKQYVDAILVISNDKIREMYGNAKQSDAFNHANNILTLAAKSISEIITVPGFINIDFADLKHVMQNSGAAIIGCATAEGEGRAMKAIQGALNSPLLNDSDIRGAKKILMNISYGLDEPTIDEITEINEYIQDVAKDTDIIFGTCVDETLENKISVVLVATGFEANTKSVYNPVSHKVVRVLMDEVEAKQEVVEMPKTEVKEEAQVNTNIVHSLLDEPVAELHEEEEISLFSSLNEATENSVSMDWEVSVNNNVVVTPLDEEIPMTTTEETPETVEEFVVEMPIIEETVTEETMLAEENFEDQFSVEEEPQAELHKEDDMFITNIQNAYSTPFNMETQNRELTDRKRKLSEMSFRVNKNNLNELESTPAYLRQGVDIGNEAALPSQEKHMSSFTVSEDTFNQRPEIKQNNSFLHDNVD
ncbi:MAG TPA: cell division protein FtsZ [Chitinophagales bacterium]